MAIKPKDIYKGAKKTHRAAKIFAAVLVLLVVGAIGLFFGLRHCCIYDEEGNATLILPTSKENRELLRAYREAAAAQEAGTSSQETQAPADSPSPDDSQQPGEGDEPEDGQTEAGEPGPSQNPEGGTEGDTPQTEGGTEPGNAPEGSEPSASPGPSQ